MESAISYMCYSFNKVYFLLLSMESLLWWAKESSFPYNLKFFVEHTLVPLTGTTKLIIGHCYKIQYCLMQRIVLEYIEVHWSAVKIITVRLIAVPYSTVQCTLFDTRSWNNQKCCWQSLHNTFISYTALAPFLLA